MIWLYRMAIWFMTPCLPWVLRRRAIRGKEDPQRLNEKFGYGGQPRPEGRLLWFHGASVGECLSLLPLVDDLLSANSDLHILVTSGTTTSAELMAERLPQGAIHQFAPLDLPAALTRFFDHWRPDLAVWVESELWPNQLREAARRGVPMVLLNARMSQRSFRRWRRFPKTIRGLLGLFTLCLAQSSGDRDRLLALGAASVEDSGNLKDMAPPLPDQKAARRTLQAAIAGRPVWLAASTHPGEEEVIAAMHRNLAAQHRGLLSIIVPRHPERGAPIAEMIVALGQQSGCGGLSVALRSKGELPDQRTEIYIADGMGELGLFYRLCDIVFVGGSLVPHGGQNPLEPARLDCAILYGPHMHNFVQVEQRLRLAGAAAQVADAAGLTAALTALLENPSRRADMAQKARALTVGDAGKLTALSAKLSALLPPLKAAGRA